MTLQDVIQFIDTHSEDEKTIREINKHSFKYVKKFRDRNKSGLVVANREKTLTTTGVSEQATWLAKYMGQEVKKRYPWYEPRTDEWARDIERIHTLGCIGEQRSAAERFDWGTIKGVCIFSQQDEFWQQQVRSGANLRKHFNKLLIKAKKHVEDNTIETI